MDLGRCRSCATPYTAAEVVGLGILRARPAAEGGPRIEYRCAHCRAIQILIPYGEGRYAPPGELPPDRVPEAERVASWARPAPASPPGPPPSGAAPGGPPPPGAAAAPPPGPPPPPPPPAGRSAPAPPALGPVEACEILGVAITAPREELERAFRQRSLACHPDKVAHLDEDFRALAESKFKRLVEAFRLLTQE